LVAPTVGTDECFHLFQVTLLGLLAWFDDDLVAAFAVMLSHWKLSDGETQKVKPDATFVLMKRVGDVGLVGFQVNPIPPARFPPGFERLKRIQVFAENDKIIRKADDHYPVLSLERRLSDGGFETMQGYVGEQGRDYPPLGRACFGWKDFAVLEDACFQPAAHLSVDDWDAVEFG
jgi:hypothetical protein